MKHSNKFSRKSGQGFFRILDSIVRHCHMYSLWDGLFLFSSVAFLLFWGMVHALSDRPYGFLHYCLSMGIALGIGGLVYLAVACLPRRGRVAKILANTVLIAVFSFTALIPLGLMTDTVTFIAEPPDYFSTEYADEVLLSQMIENTRFLGRGAPVPDEVNVYFTTASFDDSIWEDHLLIASAYTYGSWMVLVLFVIVAVWCLSSVRIYLKIYSRWFEWVFVICFFAVTYQMIPPLLFATGLLPEKSYVYEAFYSSYRVDSMVFFLTGPIAAMLAIIKRNNDAI